MMHIIIHDLGSEYDEFFNGKADKIISANGKYAPCQGCFGCWTKHPAECFMKDTLHTVCRDVGRSDILTIITENCYGAYSPAVKNILDRSIGDSTPFSTYRGKQMHHTLRYGMGERIQVFAYGDFTDAEEKTFTEMAQRNAYNFGYKESRFTRFDTPEELQSIL